MSADSEIPSESVPRPARRSVGAVRSEESANAILDAAAEILSEGGNAAFTMEAVGAPGAGGQADDLSVVAEPGAAAARRLSSPEGRGRGRLPRGHGGRLRTLHPGTLGVLARDTAGRGFRLVVAESQTDAAAAEALADYFRQRRAEFIAAVAPPGADAEAVGTVHDMLIGFNLGRLLTGRLDDDPLPIAFVAMTLAHALAAAID